MFDCQAEKGWKSSNLDCQSDEIQDPHESTHVDMCKGWFPESLTH